MADKGYKKAYYPLANKYFADGYNKEAEKWTVKCISMNVDVDQAKSLLKKIEEKMFKKHFLKKIGQLSNTMQTRGVNLLMRH